MPRFSRPCLDDAFSRDLAERFPPDRPHLVAVSGGRDSVALLDLLLEGGYHDLVVVHVNHRLRGRESDEDERFVAELARDAGLSCESRSVDVRALAEAEGLSLETAAREARYREFAAVARGRGIDRVFLAHHADDQVETVLINFFRGGGPKGLSGMDLISTRTVDGVPLELIRPLLGFDRDEIDRYLAERDLRYRDDSSNTKDFALRNRIRSRVLPLLRETFGREVDGAVLRSAELMRRLEDWAAEETGPLPHRENGLDVAALRALHPARRDRLLLDWLRGSGVPDCGFAEVERTVAVLLSDGAPAKANLPGGRHVRRRQGVLFLE